MEVIKSLWGGSKYCVRVGGRESEWFQVRVGLRQGGCLISILLSGEGGEVMSHGKGSGSEE